MTHQLSNSRLVVSCLAAALIVGCTSAAESTGSNADALSAPGALIRLDLTSKVGVLLDEIPAGPEREAAAAQALAQPADFWTSRATRQARYTYYRLVFRGQYYPWYWSNGKGTPTKGPLPLPPKGVWNVQLTGSPSRVQINGHDYVAADYHFNTHLLTDAASPGVVEPNLATVGGTWDESFNLPIDPELLLERTGYACMDEDEYPPYSVFEENTWYFYDDTCHVETPNTSSCHITQYPTESCVESLSKHVGVSKTAMHFTRVAWDPTLADQVRVGRIVNPTGADLAVVQSDMDEQHAIFYRYFQAGSCEFDEGVISSPGWRRLLAFSATVRNDGVERVHIGDVSNPSNPWLAQHIFEFSPCHHHYHFTHYGTFGYAGAPGSKRAFCLEDTNRFHNDEHTPLTAEHQTCHYQGIGAGWGDEYEFGIPGQWVDITGLDTTTSHDLTFNSNPDHFLCEGTPVLDASGNPIFDPSEFTDPAGNVVGRERCDMPPTWHDNNFGSVPVSAPMGGSFVTEPCTRGQVGPLRDCDYSPQALLKSCTPGQTVTLSCQSAGAPQVLRICEKSEALGTGVACSLRDSSANTIIGTRPTTVSFTCPAVRDASVAGTGGYSVYQAPLLSSEAAASVTCSGW